MDRAQTLDENIEAVLVDMDQTFVYWAHNSVYSYLLGVYFSRSNLLGMKRGRYNAASVGLE